MGASSHASTQLIGDRNGFPRGSSEEGDTDDCRISFPERKPGKAAPEYISDVSSGGGIEFPNHYRSTSEGRNTP